MAAQKNETGQKYRNEGMLNERKWKKEIQRRKYVMLL